MREDRFAQVVSNLEYLLSERARQGQAGDRPMGVPWIVPQLIKTPQTLGDMESFFDRWVHFAGHAVIAPATTGRGPDGDLIDAASPVTMAPPRRFACRQLDRRMSIHADGRAALCDQDWLTRNHTPNVQSVSLADAWASLDQTRQKHHAGAWDELPLCTACVEWHRP